MFFISTIECLDPLKYKKATQYNYCETNIFNQSITIIVEIKKSIISIIRNQHSTRCINYNCNQPTCLSSLLGWGKVKRWTEFVVAASTITVEVVSKISTLGRSEAFWKWIFSTFPSRFTSSDSSDNSRTLLDVLLNKKIIYSVKVELCKTLCKMYIWPADFQKQSAIFQSM